MAGKQQTERMPANASARLVNFRLTQAELEEANHFAAQTYRSRALFIRMMYLRGLQAFQGDLDEQ
ncbi:MULTISPECIES: hypothetical protein [Herbaspirillum]|jgi:hypothetical protein|uniref:hypothetical protein n=1 Tax=Herbaspirillum TaxID=963 RepID=UPI0009823CC8|nr:MULTISPECIES: hypothetical protein [Herbaspirillum]MCI1016086.1 hypothetical protein [Herbaspirillum sp. C7C2]ONN63634.1 hypothetical protein BTM36_25715 [Herbaspirillum sp. VT-16-41]UIN23183.1 hypothetical protein LAZ82_08795 [Herbaspirillum frisingense]